MTNVFFAILILYGIKILLFYFGAKRATRKVRSEHNEHVEGCAVDEAATMPTVSVIVAARNEEEYIENCVRSLLAVDYPRELLEIVIIDDQSTDRTAEILSALSGEHPGLTVLRTSGERYNLRGKANAIAQAIDQTTGKIIMTSDADCVVPVTWVRATVRQYARDVGCVCGFTLIRESSVFSGIQALDWAYMLTIASAGVGWGYSLSAVGNNMSYRRAAYDDVGGYAGVGFSITEDFALFKAISYKSHWQVRYPLEPDALVCSEPCRTPRDLYLQKKRWGNGGLDIHPLGFAIMSIGFLMNACILVLPFFGLPAGAWLIGLVGKSLGDLLLLSLPLKYFGKRSLLRYFPVFELYYLFYVTVLPFVVALAGKVEWKGRKY